MRTALPHPRTHPLCGLGLLLLLLGALGIPTSAEAAPPGEGPLVVPTAAVAADHPLASAVGVEILQRGGNAADAAIATGLVLGVVNPFASGIGGGGFLVWRGDDGTSSTLDFRERAPMAAHPEIFVVDGEVPRERFLWSGLSVAVPGEIAGWWELHQRYGSLEWSALFEPAIRYAKEGFPAGELLPERLRRFDRFAESPDIRSLFWREDDWVEEGDLVVQPRLARALEAIAHEGPHVFYEGWIADDIVETTAGRGGIMQHADLATYRARWRDPITTSYRGLEILAMGAPSSSGVVLGQSLSFLERFALRRLQWDDPMTAHLVLQALTHSFADRALHHGDDAFTDIPVEAMLAPGRIDLMHELWNPARIQPAEAYGEAFPLPDDRGTSHFSIVDAEGNAIAVTVTVNLSFGSLIVGEESGIVLNNEMADFSGRPGGDNVFGLPGGDANKVEAGKAPLSSMSPLIVVEDGALLGTLGGSGGPRIISGTLLVLLQVVDFDRNVYDAIVAPRLHHQWSPFVARVEDGAPAGWSQTLEEFGYEVDVQSFGNAVQAIWRHPQGWQAMSDPRKRGAPAGY